MYSHNSITKMWELMSNNYWHISSQNNKREYYHIKYNPQSLRHASNFTGSLPHVIIGLCYSQLQAYSSVFEVKNYKLQFLLNKYQISKPNIQIIFCRAYIQFNMSSQPTVNCYPLEHFLSLFRLPVSSLLSPSSSTSLVILARKSDYPKRQGNVKVQWEKL